MAGITELTPEAELEWQELTESFSTSHVFNDFKDSVSNFVTSYEVTSVTLYSAKDDGRRHQRMMRGDFQPSRGLQDQQDVIIVEYTQTVKYNTIDAAAFPAKVLVAAPFEQEDNRNAYTALLQTSSQTLLSEVRGVSPIRVPTPPSAAPTPAPDEKGSGLSKPAIIGIACGGAGLLIVIVLFFIYCRGGDGDGGDDKSVGDPPLHVDVRNDEVSTLAGPDGPPTYGDRR